MIPLSVAMIKGAEIAPANARTSYFDATMASGVRASDPLGAAYLGHLHPGAVEAFWGFVCACPEVKLSAHMIRGLHRAWPHIGQSVRAWPTLAAELEKLGTIPVLRLWQTEYRQEIHVSLWKVICDLHDKGRTKGEIAELLGRHGL